MYWYKDAYIAPGFASCRETRCSRCPFGRRANCGASPNGRSEGRSTSSASASAAYRASNASADPSCCCCLSESAACLFESWPPPSAGDGAPEEGAVREAPSCALAVLCVRFLPDCTADAVLDVAPSPLPAVCCSTAATFSGSSCPRWAE